MYRVIIFGTGRGARTVYSTLNHDKVEIIAFSDNNTAMVGTFFYEKPVVAPQSLAQTDYDYIIIGSQYYKEIKDGLTKLGIPDAKIIAGLEFSDIIGDPQREVLFSGGPVAKYSSLKILGNNKVFAMNEAFVGSPGKIGIHIHLYYIDLLEEFYGYLCNMPFVFDLYISVTDIEHERLISQTLRDVPKLAALKVEVVPNKGRDVAPFVVTFAKDLLKYDYVCHLHSKKSMRSGTEQSDWRKHLLANLLGSEDTIRKIFAIFDKHSDVGIVYPTTFSLMPYWAHTWLSNQGVASAFLQRMGIGVGHSSYFDYPVGNMYWARGKVLSKLLSFELTYHDFEEELGQTDGSIAHAIERSPVFLAYDQGMTFAEIDTACNLYSKGCGSRNLWQYWGKNSGDKQKIDEYDVITFDIFDTLITRRILEPDFAFMSLERKVASKYNVTDFVATRKLAENRSRRTAGDCSLDDIYAEFEKLTGLTDDICDEIKEMEVQNEIELSIPREDVVAFFDYAKAQGKKIVLITDMYLRKGDIVRILDKCGISGYHDIWLSCDKGIRKDTGAIWDAFRKEYTQAKCLHIGDNEQSDIQQTVDRKMDNYHVMSGLNLFANTHTGNYLYTRYRENMQWGDAVLLGSIAAKEFNSPFALSGSNGIYQLKKLESLGYVIFGPILLYFVIWLIKCLRNDNVDVALFLSREGYLLEKLFNKTVRILGHTKVDARYFLCSRRATSVPTLSNKDDILSFVKNSYFKGTIANLLYYRLGLQVDDNDPMLKKYVELPKDYEKAAKIIESHAERLLKQTCKEKTAYLKYCQSLELNKDKNIAVVDLGYSGTIQYYLAKLMERPIKGYYFVTSSEEKALQYSGSSMKACYGEKQDHGQTDRAIYKYHLILESILTSPDGQFQKFESNGEEVIPVFGQAGYSQQKFSSIQQIHNGISQYFDDVLTTHKESVLEMPVTEEILQDLLGLLIWSDCFLTEEVKGIFSVEDNYCSSKEISVFEWYKPKL